MQAFIIGGVCMFIYGSFLSIRGMVRLYKEKEIKMLISVLVFFIIAPLLIWGGLSMPLTKMNVWIAIPVLVFGLAWVCFGYFLEAYMRREKKRRLDGIRKTIPARPESFLRHNLILLAVALVVWVYGAFFGIANPTLETCALCVSVFLFARGVSTLWKYRGF